MDDSLLQELQVTSSLVEKAAIIADFILAQLPDAIVLLAHRCAILHWFDEQIIATLLQDSVPVPEDARGVYEQIASLPFVDTLSWGLAFQDLTREGLIKRYSITQPELFCMAAKLAAPVYETYENKALAAEALFCYTLTHDTAASSAFLSREIAQANNWKDWHYFENLLHLQEEAEHLLFVLQSPRSGQQWVLQGIVHQFHGNQEEAIHDYSEALVIDPNNTFTYIMRGNIFAEEQLFEKAIRDYKQALQFDPALTQAYYNQGIIHMKQEQYLEALENFTSSLYSDPGNTHLLRCKGKALLELGQYEEALLTYDNVLQRDSHDALAYVGQAKAYCGLAQYPEALKAYEQALLLNSEIVEALIGKGEVLYHLHQFSEAFEAYEQALLLDPQSVDTSACALLALEGLHQYVQTQTASSQALPLDENSTEEYKGKAQAPSSFQHSAEDIAMNTQGDTFAPPATNSFRIRENVLLLLSLPSRLLQNKLAAFIRHIRRSIGALHPKRVFAGVPYSLKNTGVEWYTKSLALSVLVVLVLAFLLAGTSTYNLLQRSGPYLPTNATIIIQIQRMGKLETASYTLQQIITYSSDVNSWWHFLGDSQKLFVVYGTITAGIDLSKLRSNDIQIQGNEIGKASITLHTPAPQILNTAIDPSRTQIYDTNSGISGLWNQNLDESTTLKILAAAKDSLQSHACQEGILQQAAESARAQLTSLLTSIGFSRVTITIPPGTCG